MPADHITSRFVDGLAPKDKEYCAWDGALRGFHVRVAPSGRKVYAVRFRAPSGVQRRKNIGDAAITNATVARERARKMLDAVAGGKDPVAAQRQARAQAKAAGTYKDVVEDFIAKWIEPRQRTAAETRRVLLTSGAPWLKRPFADIGEADAYSLLDGFLAEGKHAKTRVTLTYWRTLWRWAAQRKLCEAPLMDRVEVEIERRVKTRRYTDAEIRAAWAAAETLPAIEGAYIKLCILLGPRKNELAQAERPELDDPAKPTLWTVPFARTKSKKKAKRERVYLVPLPPLAQRILRGLPARIDAPELLFPGHRAKQPLDPGTWLARKIRDASGIEDWTYHTCRDTIASWLQDRGYDEYSRGLVLNHSGPGTVTADYSHGYALELKRKMLEEWAAHVAQVVAAKGVEVLR